MIAPFQLAIKSIKEEKYAPLSHYMNRQTIAGCYKALQVLVVEERKVFQIFSLNIPFQSAKSPKARLTIKLVPPIPDKNPDKNIETKHKSPYLEKVQSRQVSLRLHKVKDQNLYALHSPSHTAKR